MSRAAVVAVFAAALASCQGSGTGPTVGTQVGNPLTCRYPDVAAGERAVAHVCAEAEAPPDGSTERPYPTVGAALAALGPKPALVRIAAGRYPEAVRIDHADVRLVGYRDTEQSTVLAVPAGEIGVYVAPEAGATLTALEITGATTAGAWVRGGRLTLERCRIANVAADGERRFGFGALASEGATLVVRDARVTDTAGLGVAAVGAMLEMTGSTLERTAAGGVRVEAAPARARIAGNTITEASGAAVAVVGAAAEVRDNRISATRTTPGGEGDGVVVSPLTDADGLPLFEADAAVTGNAIESSARVGVLVAGGATALVEGNRVTGSLRGGIWIQGVREGPPTITVRGNQLAENRYIGVCVTDGAGARVADNDVDDTLEGTFFDEGRQIAVGDGIGVFDGAYAEIASNRVRSSFRAGVVADAATGAVVDNEVVDNAYGVVLQNLTAADAVAAERNALRGNENGDEVLRLPPGETLLFILADPLTMSAARQLAPLR